jgi:hypothetical protein
VERKDSGIFHEGVPSCCESPTLFDEWVNRIFTSTLFCQLPLILNLRSLDFAIEYLIPQKGSTANFIAPEAFEAGVGKLGVVSSDTPYILQLA